jgi:hypothetical protein
MWPDGEGRRIKEIGRIVIEFQNLEDGRAEFRVALAHRGRTDVKKILQSPARAGVVHNHGRVTNNMWTLVAKALRSIGFRYDLETLDPLSVTVIEAETDLEESEDEK